MKAAGSTSKAGGATQPAEKRPAEDGHFYTAAEFMKFYREKASQKWEQAAERETHPYWKSAQKVSGSASSHGGDAAHLAAPSAVEQRIAEDGNTYTRQQFQDHYGDHADRYWREAQPIGYDAAQPVVLTPPAGAEQMTTAGDDAPQLVDSQNIPTEAAMPTAQSETIHAKGDDAAQAVVQTPLASADQMTTAGDDAPQLVDNQNISTEAAMPPAQSEAIHPKEDDAAQPGHAQGVGHPVPQRAADGRQLTPR